LSDLDSDPNYQQTFIVLLLNIKIFSWLRFLVLMRNIESKKLEKSFFTNNLILGYIKIVIKFCEKKLAFTRQTLINVVEFKTFFNIAQTPSTT